MRQVEADSIIPVNSVEGVLPTQHKARIDDNSFIIHITLDEFCVALETARNYLREHAKVTNHRLFSEFVKFHASVFAFVKDAYVILGRSSDYEKFCEQIKFFMPKTEVDKNAKALWHSRGE